MTPLNGQQKQLLFDYSMGLTSQRDSAEAERLLATHQEALEIYQDKNVDFIDAYLGAICLIKGKRIYSFDRDFDKIAGIDRKKPGKC